MRTVREEGVGDEALEESIERRWCRLCPHDRGPNGHGEMASPQGPNEHMVRPGRPPMGGPPREDTLADRPKGMEHLMAEAEGSAASGVVSGSVEGHR
jgi:hypothetical protein